MHLLVKPPSHSDGKKCLECEGLLKIPEGGRVWILHGGKVIFLGKVMVDIEGEIEVQNVNGSFDSLSSL